MTIKFSQDLRTADDIDAWLARLNREWPQRGEVARHLAGQVAALGVERPLVVELGCGSGYLAEWLLRTVPDLRYIGLDRSPYLIDYARRHLSVLAGQLDGQAEIHLRQTDLNEDHWVEWLRDHGWLSQINAVVSLQSIHDLGEADQQGALFHRLAAVLPPSAHVIYADLLLDPEHPHPRRLPAYHHLALLREAGFHSIACTLQSGEFGAFIAATEEGQ